MKSVCRHSSALAVLVLISSYLLLLSLSFKTTSSSQLIDPRTEHVCTGSIDVRNALITMKPLLDNCTVIEGNLQITLLHYYETGGNKISFPKLREVTGFLLVFRVEGLKSLELLFPNLVTIRGSTLFHNYALVIYEMLDLENIGLYSLTTIARGGVRIEKNPKLCYVDTLDWPQILSKSQDMRINHNMDANECVDMCPSKICPAKTKPLEEGMDSVYQQPLCWNNQHCQKVCSVQCGNRSCYQELNEQGQTKDICCHEKCLGACTGPLATDCVVCRKIFHNGTCQEKCPPGLYSHLDRRCLTEKECRQIGKNIYPHNAKKFKLRDDGTCQESCPAGYTDSKDDPHLCTKCQKSCPKICTGDIIDNVASAQRLRDCTVISGNLDIQIREGADNIGAELEESLGAIEEVNGYIKIVRSSTLVSLRFLKNLRRINGNAKYSNKFALYVLDNVYLKELWDNSEFNLTIANGEVSFHVNRRLCLDKIHKFISHINFLNFSGPLDEYHVSSNSNGDLIACSHKLVNLSVHNTQSTYTMLIWKTDSELGDIREFLSWTINVKEMHDEEVATYNERNTCGTDEWEMKDMRIDQENHSTSWMELLFPLRPFTRYAVYIESYTITTAKSAAVSPIIYFVTPTDTNHSALSWYMYVLSACTMLIWEDTHGSLPEKLLPSLTGHQIVTHPIKILLDSVPANDLICLFCDTERRASVAKQRVWLDPSPVRDIMAEAKYQNELHLNWRAPLTPHGIVTHYYIYWRPQLLEPSQFDVRNYCEYKLKLPPKSKTTSVVEEVKKQESLPEGYSESKCPCPCTKPPEDLKAEEAERRYQIEFQNFLHDSVYKKRDEFSTSTGTGTSRRRRSVEDLKEEFWKENEQDISTHHLNALKKRYSAYSDLGNQLGDYLYARARRKRSEASEGDEEFALDVLATASDAPVSEEEIKYLFEHPDDNATDPVSAFIEKDDVYKNAMMNVSQYNGSISHITPEDAHEPYEVGIIYGSLEFVLTNLHHFQMYSIEIVACHNASIEKPGIPPRKKCSSRAIYSARTLPSPTADTINSSSIRISNGSDTDKFQKWIRWDDPPSPNGLIVLYDLELMRQDVPNFKPEQYCIPHVQYRIIKGYKLSQLKPGHWSFRIRATSLAGNGSWTELHYFYIPDMDTRVVSVAVIVVVSMVVVVIALVILLGTFLLYKYRVNALMKESELHVLSANPQYHALGSYGLADFEVNLEQLELGEILGCGSFGQVRKGYLLNFKGQPRVMVAVKSIQPGVQQLHEGDLLAEASNMKDCVGIPHVVQMLAVCTQHSPYLLILEYMDLGDLKSYIVSCRPENQKQKHVVDLLPIEEKFRILCEITDGMVFLSQQGLVHRDLACRNCLINQNKTIKVADFGLARRLQEDCNYYRKDANSQALLPVRWLAPECIQQMKFSSSSDVWSFGVLIWELATLGEQPYGGLSNEYLTEHVYSIKNREKKCFLEPPDGCDKKLCELMEKCLQYYPQNRLRFEDVMEDLRPHCTPEFLQRCYYFNIPEESAESVRIIPEKSKANDSQNGNYTSPSSHYVPNNRTVGIGSDKSQICSIDSKSRPVSYVGDVRGMVPERSTHGGTDTTTLDSAGTMDTVSGRYMTGMLHMSPSVDCESSMATDGDKDQVNRGLLSAVIKPSPNTTRAFPSPLHSLASLTPQIFKRKLEKDNNKQPEKSLPNGGVPLLHKNGFVGNGSCSGSSGGHSVERV